MSTASKSRAPAPAPERTERKHVRRVEHVSAGGRSDVTYTVPCSGMGRDVSLDVCGACARCRSMPEDATLVGAEVVCRVDPPNASGPRLRDLDMVEAALRTPLGDVVSSHATALDPDVSLEVATRLARERGMLALAVVDADQKPVGVVTWTELVANAGDATAQVGHIGRPVGSAYAKDGPLLHALPAVSDDSVGYAIVVSKDGTFYGLLTASDVARWLARRAGYEI
jgi:predicted transcriptional regulator